MEQKKCRDLFWQQAARKTERGNCPESEECGQQHETREIWLERKMSQVWQLVGNEQRRNLSPEVTIFPEDSASGSFPGPK